MRRRGITLLEVAISMFILLVGVLSVFSLITLGRYEMLEGSKADRAMSLARSAQQDMLTRGFLKPLSYDVTAIWVPASASPAPPSGAQYQIVPNWIVPTAAGSFIYPWGPATTPPSAWPPGSAPVMPFDGGAPVALALDPLGVAANLSTPGYSQNFPAWFATTGAAPVTTPTSPATPMVRMSLRAGPGSNYITYAGGTLPIMTPQIADMLFRAQDDLELFAPVGNFPPTQKYAYSSSAAKAVRRQSTGDYSWLATIVPSSASAMGAPASDTESVVVTVIVFYKRFLNLTTGSTTTAPPERMVNLAPATNSLGASTGLGGGDVFLSCPVAFTSDYIKVRPNQWILLSQTPNVGQAGFWRWYRVAATSDPTSNGTSWVRPVTLAGPDWNPSITTFASIFDGAIGAYERTIELEELGSDFSPN